MEEMIPCILNAVTIQVLPPTSAEITRLPGSEFRLAVRQELESPMHRQRIRDDKGVVIEPLTGDEHDTGSALAEPRRGQGVALC